MKDFKVSKEQLNNEQFQMDMLMAYLGYDKITVDYFSTGNPDAWCNQAENKEWMESFEMESIGTYYISKEKSEWYLTEEDGYFDSRLDFADGNNPFKTDWNWLIRVCKKVGYHSITLNQEDMYDFVVYAVFTAFHKKNPPTHKDWGMKSDEGDILVNTLYNAVIDYIFDGELPPQEEIVAAINRGVEFIVAMGHDDVFTEDVVTVVVDSIDYEIRTEFESCSFEDRTHYQTLMAYIWDNVEFGSASSVG